MDDEYLILIGVNVKSDSDLFLHYLMFPTKSIKQSTKTFSALLPKKVKTCKEPTYKDLHKHKYIIIIFKI